MIQLKRSNISEIDTHLKNAFSSKIRGSKLFALLKLTELKGRPVEAPENDCLNGVKVLEYKKGYYIGFYKKTFKNGDFELKTFSLKNI